MELDNNPYTPGASRLPAAFVGRQKELDLWAGSLRRIENGRDARPLALSGLRGMGKTVLLTHFAQTAQENQWLVAQVEAGSGKALRQLIAEQFQAQLGEIARGGFGQRTATALKTLLSFAKISVDMTGNWTFGVDVSNAPGGGADTGILEADLGLLIKDLTRLATERKIGVALLVDEAQLLTKDETQAFCQILQANQRAQTPLMVALTGLPNLPLTLAKGRTYAERLFDYHDIGSLTPAESAAALAQPATQEGVTWDDGAANLVLDAAGGYPYFIQQFGSDTWSAAQQSPISIHDARVGLATGIASLDRGFYRSRWERATPAEQNYLIAMAVDGDRGSTTADVAARLGKTQSAVSQRRSALISKGLIFAATQGRISFSVPAMGEFIVRQQQSGAAT